MIECSFASLLKEDVPVEKKFQRGSAIRFIQGEKGILKQINGIEQVKSIDGVVDVEIYKNIGDIICKPQNSNDRVGHIIAVGENADKAAQVAEQALGEIEVIVD